MTDQKHAKEPWVVASDCDSPGTLFICPQIGNSSDEKHTANLRRVVACVNACAGIEDPAAVLKLAREALGDLIQIHDSISLEDYSPICKITFDLKKQGFLSRAREALKLLGGEV